MTTTTTKPNIVPCIAVEIPPQSLDILIDAMHDYLLEHDLDPEQDWKMAQTLLKLLEEIRNDYRSKIAV